MAKKEPKKDLLDLSEFDAATSIVSTLKIERIMLKDSRWEAKIYIQEILPRSYRNYKVSLELDEEPYLRRIEELEKSLDETLFREDAGMRKVNGKKISEVRAQLEKLNEDCEKIRFVAIVDELKYKNNSTLLTIRIPDDTVEPFNRQKHRLDLYKITLTPTF